MSEQSKTVLITGCSSGIGRATAQRLARSGFAVYATARKLEAIADLEQYGCRLLTLDVCDKDSMRGAVETIEREHGAVDVLVNNAGYSQSGAVESVPLDAVRRQFETNVFGLVQLTQLVLPGMRERGAGRVVNVGSMGGKLTFPGGGFYHATKYAVESISDALRFEVSGFGIDVVLIEPGLIKSNFGDTAVSGIGEAMATDGPYDTFNAAVGAATAGAYTGPTARLFGGTPDTVARKIERAISARRPRTRYLVTPSARIVITLRHLLGDRGFDRFLRRQFPTPRRR